MDIAGIENFLPESYDGMGGLRRKALSPQERHGRKMKYILVDGKFDGIAEDLNNRYNAALDKEKAAGTIKTDPMPDFNPIKL